MGVFLARLRSRVVRVSEANPFPTGHPGDKDLLLDWLRYLRGAVVAKLDGLSEEQAHWRPGNGEGSGEALLPLLGIVNHLTRVEWRWIDGAIGGAEVSRDTSEFFPGPELTIDAALTAYRKRAAATDAAVRSLPLDTLCPSVAGADLRWVLVHLVNETARHAGHADATRELLDGTTGE